MTRSPCRSESRNRRQADNFLSEYDLWMHDRYRHLLTEIVPSYVYASEEADPQVIGDDPDPDLCVLVDPLDTSELAVRTLYGYTHVLVYSYAVTIQVIVLNGGSSAGKSEIVRQLQAVLPQPWLAFGVDSLIEAMPQSMQESDAGIEFAPDGGVSVGPEFIALQAAWMEGIAAMVRAGARVIIDDLFLGGAATQQRWQRVLDGLDVLWVGVMCDSAIAAERERSRGDRIEGMAVAQAKVVHEGVVYDLRVDTTRTESLDCAKIIADHVRPSGERADGASATP